MTDSQNKQLPSDDDVVITGIGGIFPSCDNIDELKESLLKNEYLCKSVENDRNWKRDILEVPDKVGRIKNPAKFDNIFFGISEVQSTCMDPLTRKMLERAYEAVIDSGHNPMDIKKYQTNVYMGSSFSDSENTYLCSSTTTNSGFTVLGNNRSMLANRVSYWLNTHGTSNTFLAAEPAGLMGISMAYRDIKAGYCDAAIVGTVFLMHHPEPMFQHKEMGILSKDGKCKSFDADADGYSRGEACVAIFLQRACDARRIYSTVVHSDYICYGNQERLISPHDTVFSDFLSSFYETCGVDPNDISYLEADGSATKIHDPEELNAVDKILLSERKKPLLIGSVKTNLGHADAASTFTGLAKVIIAMETGLIPSTLFYKTPSPLIPALREGKLKVVTENTKWNGGLVAINGLGMGCHYSHTLLQSYNKSKCIEQKITDNIPRLVCVSGRNEEAVEHVMNKILCMPFDLEFLKLIHDIHTKNIPNHNYRGYIFVLPEKDKEVKKELQLFSGGAKKPVWYVFSGMGSQWVGMGRDLMRLPVLASTLQKCHDVLLAKGIDLLHIIAGDDPHIFDNILNSFVGIAAIQLALVDLLKLLKIEPDGIIGHSVGELGCAYADGCFTLEQMILAAYYRGLASIETASIHGSMAAIGCSYDNLKDKVPEGVDIACHNSSDSCTISGPTEVVLQYVETLKAQNTFAKAVNVANIAYHSRYIKPAAPKLLAYLRAIIPDPKPRSSRWISSSVPEEIWDTHEARFSSAEYHTNNLLGSVLFEEASKHIPKNAIVIEIAPHGLLQAILRRSLGGDCINVPLTQQSNPDGLKFLLASIGKLYLAGLTPSISEIYPPVQYPVSRGTPSLSPLFAWQHNKAWHVPSIFSMVDSCIDYEFEVDLRYGDSQILRGQRVNGHVIYPPSAYLNAVWVILFKERRMDYLKHPVLFQDVKFHNVLKLSENNPTALHVTVVCISGMFEVSYDKKILVTGIISIIEEEDKEKYLSHNVCINLDNDCELSGREVYMELEYKGHQYNSFFKKIAHASTGEEGAAAKILWSGSEWLTFIDSVLQVVMWQNSEDSFTSELPSFIQKVFIDPNKQKNTSSELMAVYQKSTNIVQCGGIEMSGIEMSKVNLGNSYKLNFETVRFFSHGNPNIQNKRDFLEISVQLLLENLETKSNHRVVTVVELTNNLTLKSILHEMKYILSHEEGIKADLRSVSTDKAKTLSELSNISLVLVNEDLMEYGFELLKNSSRFLLLRLPAKQYAPANKEFVIVTAQQFDNEKYILLKKRVPIKNQTVSFIHVKGDSSTWIERVKNAANGNKMYVICEEESYEKVQSFITEVLNSGPKSHSIRYIFILDKNVSWTSHTDPQISDQLSQDLLINVYYNGEWGSFKRISLPAKNYLSLKNLVSALSIPNFNVSFTSLNINDWCVNENEESAIKADVKNLGAVEFSGHSSSGKRMMGLAKINKKRNMVEFDPLYTWSVPETWSLHDAATVPLAYCLAYYTLTIKTKIKYPAKTILVHGGHTLIGEAFIAVALQFRCTVYTTVSNDDAIQHLRRKFPQIPDRNIFKINKLFNYELMNEVKGKGVDIIISCLNGTYFEITLKCAALFTEIFYFCQSDIQENTELGLSMFLECCSFTTVLQHHLFDVNSQTKKEIHDKLENGIISGVVQPLSRKVFSLDDGEEEQALQSLNFTRKVLIEMNERRNNVIRSTRNVKDAYQFKRQRSCLVVGSRPEDCLDVAKWLVTKSVHAVIMYSEAPHTSEYVKRQLKILHSSYTPQVRFSFVDKSQSPQVLVTSLLKECTDTAPLDSVFLISFMDKLLLHHLDKVTRNGFSVNSFVCLSTDIASSAIQSQREAGVTVLDVKWSSHHTLQQILQGLETLLSDPPLSTVYISLREEGDKEVTTMSDYERVKFLLPSSQEELVAVGLDVFLQESVPYEELVSQSPGINYVKEILPIFVIPGLQGSSKKICESLARNMMYPIILLRIPPHETIYGMASILKNQIRAIQKEGPYNILGLTWAGALTLQIAQELQNEEQKTQTFLLDGTPEVIQKIVKELGEDVQLQTNLLMKLLDIPSEKLSDYIINCPTWETRLKCCLREIKTATEKERRYILKAMNAIYYRLQAILNYKLKDLSLEHEVYVLQSQGIEDEYDKDFDEVSGYKMKFQSQQGDHHAMLSNRSVANIICDNTLVNLHRKTPLRLS